VNNHDQDNLESTMTLPTADRTTDQMSMKLSPAKSEKFAAPAPTEEDLAREAESIREYKERKQRAKQKREEKAKREIQRVLDEKKMVEEELEELRMSSQQQQQQQQYQHTQPGTAGGEDGSAGEKKLLKLKKKYEKRVQSLKEELDEVREDFAYQRKQLMDAVVEQEKDTRLYEAICRSLVTERDLQKLIEKCRYDEDRDEWIVPFAKKKNVDHWIGGNSDFGQGSMPPLAAGGLGGGGGGGGNGGSAGVGNAPLSSRSMLPDIGSSNASRYQQQLQTNNANGSGNGSGSGSANSGLKPQPPLGQIPDKRSNKSKQGAAKKKLKVPLLTLPGSLVSASDLTDNDAYDSEDAHPSHGYADDGRGGHYPPQYSSRSEYNYGDENGDGNDGGGNGGNGGGAGGGSGSGLGGFSLPGIGGNGEKKKAKAKVPKGQSASGAASSSSANYSTAGYSGGGNNNNTSSGNSSHNNSYHNMSKMPAISSSYDSSSSAGGGGGGGIASVSESSGYGTMMDQAGSGETAGPIEDWGFVVQDRRTTAKKGADYDVYGEMDAPEEETNYSDDEDFVVSGSGGNGGGGKKGGKKGKKSKDKKGTRQARNSRDNDDFVGNSHGSSGGGGGGGGGGMFPSLTGATPRQSGFSLPPI
jgi:hypothetical protein